PAPGRSDVHPRTARRGVHERRSLEPRRDRGARACARLAAHGGARRGGSVLCVSARRERLRAVISYGPRRRRRPRAALWLALVAAGVVLFAIGVAVGEADDDNPHPGGTQTYVLTHHPLMMAPLLHVNTDNNTKSA